MVGKKDMKNEKQTTKLRMGKKLKVGFFLYVLFVCVVVLGLSLIHIQMCIRDRCNAEWYSKMRNIDPTLLIYDTKILSYEQAEKSWVSDYDFLPLDINDDIWIEEMPNFIDKLINYKDPDGNEWLALCCYPFWNEYKSEDVYKRQVSLTTWN